MYHSFSVQPRTVVAVLASCLLIAAVARADDRRVDKSRLVIMTLNTEFLWDGKDPEQGQVSFPWKGSVDEAEEHMGEIAELIIRADADIVNLVEVENLPALERLNDKFLADRSYKAYLIEGKDTYTGEDVGMLTRIDPESMRYDDRVGQSGSTRKSVSKNYVARFETGPGIDKFSVIGLHLLAIPEAEYRKPQRQAQADAIRSMAIDETADGREVIILGDFNDYDGSDECSDHIDSAPITGVLSMIRALDPDNDSDDLTNVASAVDKSNRYTSFYDRNRNGSVDYPEEYTSIDHILLSPRLADRIEYAEIPHNHNPLEVTDHYPVVACLRTGGPLPGIVRMKKLLPNPVGDERQNETVTLVNDATATVNLTGWLLRDRAGKTWSLDGLAPLAPGAELEVPRKGQPMTLNNDGDTIDLVDPSNRIVHSVSYSRVDEGELVFPSQ